MPKDFKYEFLGPKETFSMVVTTHLDENQEEHLLYMFHKHKKVLDWNIADIKSMDLLSCIYQITLEDDPIFIRKMQRTLNPAMKEVVKVTMLKLLNAGIIDPIVSG